MDMPKLTAPRLRVVMEDGSEHQVQALNIDMLAWDRARALRGWPKAEDAPFVWMTFLAHHALLREKTITDISLGTFERTCYEVSVVGEQDADPTQLAAEPD